MEDCGLAHHADLCWDYFNSVKPQGLSKSSPSFEGFIDLTAHHKKSQDFVHESYQVL